MGSSKGPGRAGSAKVSQFSWSSTCVCVCVCFLLLFFLAWTRRCSVLCCWIYKDGDDEASSGNPCYRITQQPLPSPFSNVNSAARVAASNTSSTPSPLKLEHSRYRLAPTSRAATSPSWGVRKRCDFFRISSTATGSSRRSFFSPTSIIGTPEHRRVASSIHCK